MLRLHNIQVNKKNNKKRKRVGRGDSAGQGSYCGRGIKGQNARSGVSGLKRLGMKKNIQQLPKLRGFKSHKPKNQVVDLEKLNKYFKDDDKINPDILLEKKLIKNIKHPVKILFNGELKLKGLSFENIKMSKKVVEIVK